MRNRRLLLAVLCATMSCSVVLAQETTAPAATPAGKAAPEAKTQEELDAYTAAASAKTPDAAEVPPMILPQSIPRANCVRACTAA